MKILECLANAQWITKSLILMVGMAIFTMGVPLAVRQGIKSEVVIGTWCLGIFLGISTLIISHSKLVGAQTNDLIRPMVPILIILCTGFILGSFLNILFGQALQGAPNPAYPVAISNASLVIVCLLGPILARFWPKIFPLMTVSSSGIIGVILIIFGMILIARK